ncbi:hypothetical protein [Tychonema sp. LEGE 07203]|uniref:hypothetical protein n=1 Tax=Tychonema sp. LEGE 07203 TaxID=1828671 RepID=UPI00187FF375|nr:hypothetical protein [Tychonema sp. LEGE 07203]MBE9097298.1 hypothetical protein [Tychonema sp. LEGE 07203]
MSEVSKESNNSQTFDAQQISENVEAGEQKLQKVDVSADYEASKEFSVSEVDRTSAGAKAAAAATKPKFDTPAPGNIAKPADSSSKPEDFREMAKEVNPAGAPGNVTDDLVQKAIERGTPGS